MMGRCLPVFFLLLLLILHGPWAFQPSISFRPGRQGIHIPSWPLFSSTSTSPPTSKGKLDGWYKTRIQEDVNFATTVKSAYLRHVLVETEEVAKIALDMYVNALEEEDPFGAVASSVSVCPLTKEEGGRLGWTDLHEPNGLTALPKAVLDELWQRQPKSGDVHIVHSSVTSQYHLILVEELQLNMFDTALDWTNKNDGVAAPKENQGLRIGSHQGKNGIVARSKLKGKGLRPDLPTNPKTYKIHTTGCQMNAADSERLAGVLENELGMSVEDGTDPDVVVFNTCSIRDHAEQKLYDTIGPYAGKKRNGKSIALVVTGCVAQQEGEALLRRVPELDVVMGPQYVTRLKSVLDSVDLGHQVVATAPAIHSDRDFSKPIREHPVKAWVNVIYGCNEHCTYCVVPSVRGMEQSRPMEAILEECRDLAAAGYREVTLLGQNIDAYGRDMVPKRNFADLLKFLNANLKDSTNMRIRYVTSHPRYFSGKEQNNERNTTGPHEETAHGGEGL